MSRAIWNKGSRCATDICSFGMVELLTTEDVSRITGISQETLAQWRSKKINLPYLKIGKLIRYDKRDVEAYLDACKVSVSHRRQK